MPPQLIPAIISRGMIGLIGRVSPDQTSGSPGVDFARFFAGPDSDVVPNDSMTDASDGVVPDPTGSLQLFAEAPPPLPVGPGGADVIDVPIVMPVTLAAPIADVARFDPVNRVSESVSGRDWTFTRHDSATRDQPPAVSPQGSSESRLQTTPGPADADLPGVGQDGQIDLATPEVADSPPKATADGGAATKPRPGVSGTAAVANSTPFAALSTGPEVTRPRSQPTDAITDPVQLTELAELPKLAPVLPAGLPPKKAAPASDTGTTTKTSSLIAGSDPADVTADLTHTTPATGRTTQTPQKPADAPLAGTDAMFTIKAEAGAGIAALTPHLTAGPLMPPQSTPLPSHSPHVPTLQTARHVAAQIAVAVTATGHGTTEIALNPDELGRVRMQLTTTDQTLTVAIIADRAETADLMRRHVDTLVQELREQGYRQVNIDIGGRHGQGGAGRDATPPGTAAAASGQPDPTHDSPQPQVRRATLPGSSTLDLRL